MEREIKKILMYLPYHTSHRIAAFAESDPYVGRYLTEIRLRAHRPTSVGVGGRSVTLFKGETDICTAEEISSTLAKLTEDSVHTYSETMREGFISLEGGYRIGVCGSANVSDGKIRGLYGLTSLCIRIPRAVAGIDGEFLGAICRGGIIDSALVFSPPGVGKTTLIRAAAATLSSGPSARPVSVIDTRREIYIYEMFKNSIAEFLSGYPRAAGIEIATRTLSPDVVICDGFTGNILIKFGEGIGELLNSQFREEYTNHTLPKIGLFFMWPAMKRVMGRFDWEKKGGSPVLGVNGSVVKVHGRSKANAISYALTGAANFIEQNGVGRIREEIASGTYNGNN